jgi:aspartyl-tRNA(Asn)/glutamyl-tRNA(Gln) amidotransferase subunit A
MRWDSSALNAVVTVNTERALAEAATIDRRVQLGDNMPLAGVPVVVKDNIWVEGWRVTQGSRLFSHFIAPRDAVAVERLKRLARSWSASEPRLNSPARA